MTCVPHPHESHGMPESILRREYGSVVRESVVTAATGGFSGAAIWRVRAAGGQFALRRWPLEVLPRERIEVLHQFLRHLRQEEIDVIPAPIAGVGGSTLVQSGGHLWQLEPWMPGVADFWQRPSMHRLCSAMTTLARVHLSCERFSTPSAGRPWFERRAVARSPAVQERLSRLKHERTLEWVDEALRRTHRSSDADELRDVASDILHMVHGVHQVVQAELEAASQWRVRLHPCLRDVWHDHVLFQGTGVTGLIDPAATRTEHVSADLSRLLGSLLADDRPEWWAEALDEYAHHRSLTATERLLIRTLDRSGVVLSGLTWIARRLGGCVRSEDQERVRARMEAIRRRLRHLVGT